MSSVRQFVDNEIRSSPVVIFSKSYCQYSTQTKSTIKDLFEHAKVYELDERRDGEEIQDYLLELTKQGTVPNTFIGGKHIGGNDKLQSLKNKGELYPLVQEALAKAEMNDEQA